MSIALLWLLQSGSSKVQWPPGGVACRAALTWPPLAQHKHQRPVHLPGAFLTFFVGTLYFWLQLAFLRHVRDPPRTCAPWLQPLHLGLCSTCTVLVVASILPGAPPSAPTTWPVVANAAVGPRAWAGEPSQQGVVALHLGQLRPALAACEWTATMLLLGLFGLFSMDFAGLEGCALSLRLAPGLGPPPASLVCLQVQQAEGPAPALPEPAGTEAGHT
ncbi:Modulator of macroautophagy protein [Galemys pyrenaicus]|uniref:Modulator of macroautophagy protein n=1 Tax=Galemys pyrenaicus TaxID=202257 RepID=A0A8J6DW80_GALPY|nr:Modulator of macroautophagy protein [Galemys pyrenaicus]